ncbi:hypothetical protein PAXRUDRAFT_671458 [Paxillus rubicundulus Ve08.2h10]|uniref:Uncharacterized protein n=1 Tax=Paxillus rubicundulus Ve08.2h10 TaxID=930991 RepID=A0A0D0EC08_9AGAM|nr:hypothetical protein PAXRUDRAFT_671458 [Paxillus rubicundulus Ve08.2h10]
MSMMTVAIGRGGFGKGERGRKLLWHHDTMANPKPIGSCLEKRGSTSENPAPASSRYKTRRQSRQFAISMNSLSDKSIEKDSSRGL